jgi:hypothetical protein
MTPNSEIIVVETVVPAVADDHFGKAQYLQSTFYEQLVEHIFVAELLQEAWFGHKEVVEVLRAEIDASGFDIVLECRGITRHVQLKTSATSATTQYQKVSLKLGEKRGGCVVWIVRDEIAVAAKHRVKLQYRFFGALASESKLDITNEVYRVAKHTKGNSTGEKKERRGIRMVPKSAFLPAKSASNKDGTMDTSALLYHLFGMTA